MQALEKILKEIEEATYQEDAPIYVGDMEVDWYVRESVVKEIIRSHMDDGKDTNVPSNDDWIPVEERLPEHDYETVLCVDAVDYYFVAVYTKEDGFRTEDFGADYENIIAWQPLPDRTSQRKIIRQQNRL